MGLAPSSWDIITYHIIPTVARRTIAPVDKGIYRVYPFCLQGFNHPSCGAGFLSYHPYITSYNTRKSIDWFKGKITVNSHISWDNLWFPVSIFPSVNPLRPVFLRKAIGESARLKPDVVSCSSSIVSLEAWPGPDDWVRHRFRTGRPPVLIH